MSVHTPGPWVLIRNGCSPGSVGTLEGHNDLGQPMYWVTASANKLRDEWEANERLIASAPDMLDALRTYQRAWDDIFGSCLSNGVFNAWGGTVHCGNLNAAKQLGDAAIAKAEGRA